MHKRPRKDDMQKAQEYRVGEVFRVFLSLSFHKRVAFRPWTVFIIPLCMAHIRRKFVEAHQVGRHKEFLKKIIITIGQLYRLESFATKSGFTVAADTESKST